MPATLPFGMEHQLQTEWCWAAVTSSVDHFFSAASSCTQCQLANDQLGQSTCCADGSNANCNCPWFLERSLGSVKHLRSYSAGSVPFSDVTREIDQKVPLCARIGWSEGGGHFVAVYGYDEVNPLQLVFVADPWWGVSQVPYDAFANQYRGDGTWTHSYFTA